MKKVLCFLIVLVLLGASLLGVTAYSLVKESDNVTFTVIDEWGDRRAIQGITAEMNFALFETLDWDVKFTPFEKTETEYDYNTFYPLSRKGKNYYFGFSTPSLGIIELKNENSGLNELVEELKAQASELGKKTGKEINFRDYYEYYPVYVNIYLPGMSIEWQSGFGADEKGRYVSEGISSFRGQGVIDALNEFFKVPVSENDKREIIVFSGKHNGFSYQASGRGVFDFSFFDVRTDDTIYFTFENEIYSDNEETRELADTSLIPGGYGIYAMPYTENDIKHEELRTVYSVPSDASVKSLLIDEERNELYLGLYENEKYILHVIDIATMTDKTVIELFDFSYGEFSRVLQNEDFLVFMINDVEFNVVAINDRGEWESALTGTMPSETVAGRGYFSYNSRFAFDGERLVVWVFDNPGVEEIRLLSLQPDVMVFTKDGLQYYCKWLCSLGDPVATTSRWENVKITDWKVIIE